MAYLGHELHYFKRWESDKTFPNRAGSLDFWRTVCPELSITDRPFDLDAPPFVFESHEVLRAATRVRDEGFFGAGPVLEPAACAALADGVKQVIRAGFHPLFISLFDEFWKPLSRLGALLEPVFGAPPRLLGDYWAWCISPKQAPSGWAPHRDLEVQHPIGPDGRPTLVTVWIPFTDATPDNGCIYALPMLLDPNLPEHPDIYAVPRAQDVVALPAPAGSIVGWNQLILHWGGRCSPHATHPRISTGIYFQSSAFPDFRRAVPFDAPLPFEARLELIAQAFSRYHNSFQFPEILLRFIARHTSAVPA